MTTSSPWKREGRTESSGCGSFWVKVIRPHCKQITSCITGKNPLCSYIAFSSLLWHQTCRKSKLLFFFSIVTLNTKHVCDQNAREFTHASQILAIGWEFYTQCCDMWQHQTPEVKDSTSQDFLLPDVCFSRNSPQIASVPTSQRFQQLPPCIQ